MAASTAHLLAAPWVSARAVKLAPHLAAKKAVPMGDARVVQSAGC